MFLYLAEPGRYLALLSTWTEPTHTQIITHTMLGLHFLRAQLLGKQAAREAAAANNNSSTDKEGASDD